eukprot:UN01750
MAFSPRTNPLGRNIQSFYNFRTMLEPADADNHKFGTKLIAWAFWAGLPLGTYWALNNYSEDTWYKNQLNYQAHRTPCTRGSAKMFPPETVGQVCAEVIRPRNNVHLANQEYIFPALTRPAHDGTAENPNQLYALVRRAEEKAGSLAYGFGHSHNIHRYEIAKPMEDYNAIKIKANFNLAAATYYESRANIFFPKLEANDE